MQKRAPTPTTTQQCSAVTVMASFRSSLQLVDTRSALRLRRKRPVQRVSKSKSESMWEGKENMPTLPLLNAVRWLLQVAVCLWPAWSNLGIPPSQKPCGLSAGSTDLRTCVLGVIGQLSTPKTRSNELKQEQSQGQADRQRGKLHQKANTATVMLPQHNTTATQDGKKTGHNWFYQQSAHLPATALMATGNGERSISAGSPRCTG